MPSLNGLIESERELLALHPSDLGGIILEYLGSSYYHRDRPIKAHELGGEILSPLGSWLNDQARAAVWEAFQWLLNEGLLCQSHDNNSQYGVFVLTRKGRQVGNRAGIRTMVSASQLPLDMLHPTIETECRGAYLRGDLEDAVSKAFKRLEIEIRAAAQLNTSCIGTEAAHLAFKHTVGPLADALADRGEQVGLMNVMAGAIGAFKNPHSHRDVTMTPDIARDRLVIASHLLKIVDDRRNRSASRAADRDAGDVGNPGAVLNPN